MIQVRRRADVTRPPFNASGGKLDPTAAMVAERQGKQP
jgi:hypothetical protein